MSQDDKPSWSEELPEMVDAPDLSIDPDIDTEIDLDLEPIDGERPNVFDDSIEDLDDEEQDEGRPNFDFDETDEANDEEAEAQKQAEIDRVEREKAAAEKLAQEKAVAEKLAQEKAVAELAAQEKAAEEKIAREKAAEDKLAKEQAAIKENIISPELVQSDNDIIIYQWKKIVNAAPDYPARAARSGEEGWVEVEIELGINGDVVNATVVNSFRNSKTFNREAIIAVKKWKYEPPINFGIEENQFKIVKIVFKL